MNVFIGDEDDSKNLKLLKEKQITHILIAGKYLEKTYPNDFIYYQINIVDNENQDLDLYFEECNIFLKKADKILVHCVAGKSRSPAIVIGYLIGEIQMSFLDAFTLTKLKRPIINPNSNFIRNLQNYEEKLIKTKVMNLLK